MKEDMHTPLAPSVAHCASLQASLAVGDPHELSSDEPPLPLLWM